MGALDEVPLLQGGPPAKLGNASYVQVMLRCCEEVVRRIENPLAFFLGRFGGAETRAGDALYAKWQARMRLGRLMLLLASLKKGCGPKCPPHSVCCVFQRNW